MLELMYLYAIIIIALLFIEIWLLNFWAKEHATLISIISHSLVEIKKKIQNENPNKL